MGQFGQMLLHQVSARGVRPSRRISGVGLGQLLRRCWIRCSIHRGSRSCSSASARRSACLPFQSVIDDCRQQLHEGGALDEIIVGASLHHFHRHAFAPVSGATTNGTCLPRLSIFSRSCSRACPTDYNPRASAWEDLARCRPMPKRRPSADRVMALAARHFSINFSSELSSSTTRIHSRGLSQFSRHDRARCAAMVAMVGENGIVLFDVACRPCFCRRRHESTR